MIKDYEAAWWCAGPNDLDDARRRIASEIATQGAHMPIRWLVLEPRDERCPAVPGWVPMDADPRCVVGRAEPLATATTPILNAPAGAAFLGDMAPKDLARLRKITRTVAAQYGRHLTDQQCDEIIMEAGPNAAEQMLMQAVAKGEA